MNFYKVLLAKSIAIFTEVSYVFDEVKIIITTMTVSLLLERTLR